MMNLFDAAKPINSAKPARGRTVKAEVATPGIEGYAAIDSVKKFLDGLQKTLASPLKEGIARYCIEANSTDSYRALDGKASASMEMRKRGTNSPLSDDEIALAKQHRIPVEKNVITPGAFIINPEHAQNAALMALVSAALVDVPGLPVDFIQRQEEVSTTVVSEKALDAVMKINDPDTKAKLLPVFGCPAIKPSTSEDMMQAIKVIEGIVSATTAKAAPQAAPAPKPRKKAA